MSASSPVLLRHCATQGTSTIHHHCIYGGASSKLLYSQTVELSKTKTIRLRVKRHVPPLSSFTGPNEVIYWCCHCGHGPWSWDRIPHCQLCGHQQCSGCRYRAVRS